MALLAVTLYLVARGRNPWFTGVPMLFMLVSTVVAMLSNLRDFWHQWAVGGGALFVVGLVLLVLAIWLVIESLAALMRVRRRPPLESMAVSYRGES